VIAAEDGIYTVRSDGSGLRKISEQVVFSFMMGPFFKGTPSGGLLAFSEFDGVSNNLYLLSPSNGALQVITSLTSAIGQVSQGDPLFEAVTYVVSREGTAWSPDGRQLAFTGFIDDTTMDLYVYSVADGSIVRLTDGSTATYRPVWSPDGTYIAHHGVPGLLTGGGPTVDSLWVARADGSEDRKLLDRGQVEAVGWMDNENLVLSSYDSGPFNLRVVEVETSSEVVLWKDFFSDVALDPESGVLLLGVDEFAAGKNPDVSQGLYLIEGGGASALPIVEDEPEDIIWSDEAELFFVDTGGIGRLAVSITGNFIDLDVPASTSGFPLVAPEARELVWMGSELWVSKLTSGLDDPPRKVFPEAVHQATWDSEGEYLLFISNASLYVARSPDFSPELVGEGTETDLTALVAAPSIPAPAPTTAMPEPSPTAGPVSDVTADCPSPSGQTPTISSDAPGDSVVEIFEPQIVDYLNNVGSASGLRTALKDLTLLDGAWEARVQVETVDVTGNSTPDVVIELTFYEEGQYSGGGLFVFMCRGGEFVGNAILSTAGQVLSSRDPDGIRAIRDMNLDGIPEIVHSYISIAGTHAYFIREFRILEWDGQQFVDLIPKNEYGMYAQADTGDGVVRDYDGDGTLELILSNAVGEAYPDLGPQRVRTDIWAWDGQVFSLARWEFTEPEFRIHAIWDGDDASLFGDYDAALVFYQQAVFDEELFGWSQGQLWPDREYGGGPTPTPDPEERPRLNAYGRYRIMLLHAVQGNQSPAQVVFDTLQEKFPVGSIGYAYAEMATVFWEEYSKSGDVGVACEGAISYAADHPRETLVFLGRSFYGLGQREYTPEDICPFK
jgi:hypothetical protein